MSEEIRVTLLSYPDRKNKVLSYVDPVSGKRKTKSAKTANAKEAERAAAKWEEELRNGGATAPSKITWVEFREILRREKLSEHPATTVQSYESALNHVERVLSPEKLSAVTSRAMADFSAKCRAAGMGASNLASILRSVGACFRWATRIGYMKAAPAIALPRLPKGAFRGKHNPLCAEQYERMLATVVKVRPHDAPAWERFLSGLWLSGLRLGEALALTWEADGGFRADLSGKHPTFRIRAESQKSRREETCPIAPDFGLWLLAVPEANRRGKVFRLPALTTGRQMSAGLVGKVISRIARKAGVVAGEAEKRSRIDGQLVAKKVTMYASAHDFRRSFASRWAKRVMPPVLARLCRHASIAVTMAYYVNHDAQEVASDLWERFGGESNKRVTVDPQAQEDPAQIDVFG